MLLYLLSILRSENDRPCLSSCAIPDSSPNLYSLSRILRNSSSSLYSNIEVFGFFVGLFSNDNVVVTSPLADYFGDNAPYSVKGEELPDGSESAYTDVDSEYSNQMEAGISQPNVDDGVKPDSKELDSNVLDNIKPDSTDEANLEPEQHSSQTEYPVLAEKKPEVPLSEKEVDGQEIEISFDEFQ